MAENKIGYEFTGDASGLTKSVGQANKALGGLKQGSAQATFALTNLSRVAQDAPFGFIGIANNIEPLIGSFVALKKESGSTKAALSALGSSLLGGGGLVLAIGLASAALSIFGMSMTSTKDEVKKVGDEIRDANQVISDSSASVEGEISKINALASVVTNTNKSYTERKRALEQLQKVNKEYFGSLTLEESQLGKVKDAANEYTKALIQQSIVKGFQDEISKVSQELFKQRKALDEAKKNFDKFGKTGTTALQNLSRFGASFQETAGLASKGADAEETLKNQLNIVYDLEQAYNNLQQGINDATGELLKLNSIGGTGGSGKSKADKKRALENAFVTNDLAGLINPTQTNITTGAGLFGKQDQPQWLKSLIAGIEQAKAKQQELAASAELTASIITNTLGSAFQNLFNDIISGSQNAFQSFASAIAQVITKLISAAITAALLAAIIGAATGGTSFGKSFMPTFKGIFSSLSGLPKFAEGGIVTGTTLGIIGEAGTEAIIPLDRIGEVLGSVGGAQSVFVTGQLSGETIYLQQQRTSQRRGRFV